MLSRPEYIAEAAQRMSESPSPFSGQLSLLNRFFYTVKPFFPRCLQLCLRRTIVNRIRTKHAHVWPIDPNAGTKPAGWVGWPDDKQFALVLMHDVESKRGYDRCRRLLDVEDSLGFKSTFSFVPERYGTIEATLRDEIRGRGFGLAAHGLKHDGKLFRSYAGFRSRAAAIDRYLEAWGARGFTAPSMHRNLDWLHYLNIAYSLSTFDTDPFEPQPTGIGTIFPFWFGNRTGDKGFVEMPYTLPQDFTLYVLMRQRSNAIWKRKLDWIAEHGGMALVTTHPDYMQFEGAERGCEEYPVRFYTDFLAYVRQRYAGRYYHVLAEELADALSPSLKLMSSQDPVQKNAYPLN